jgi:hypothetical protein
MAGMYRYLTPTDVDQFIQIPDTLEVDARSIVLTVDEDTFKRYDKIFDITDYAIYCEVPTASFFNNAMDWKYAMLQEIDGSGNYLGPRVIDAHNPAYAPSGVYLGPLAAPVLLTDPAKSVLGSNTDSTRFAHYRQCNRFFKYSFKVGESSNFTVYPPNDADAISSDAQLFGLYINASGVPVPWWTTSNGQADQTAENKTFYWADVGSVLGTVYPQGMHASVADSPTASHVENLHVMVPPDPEFLESKNNVLGGNLAYGKDASGGLLIRAVGEWDASANGGLGAAMTTYTASNFVLFTEAPQALTLVLYWIVNPTNASKYLGERMFVAWTSSPLSNAPGALMPVRDFDASGQLITGATVPANKFHVSRDVPGNTVLALDTFLNTPEDPAGAIRLYLPNSNFWVWHEQPNEPDVHASGTQRFEVPFAYEVANTTDFRGDTKKSIMGGRVMQLISHYLFDNCTNTELDYFPFLLSEAKALTDKIIDALASKINENGTPMSETRSDLLSQILVKHGRRYFDEWATLTETQAAPDAKFGKVIDILKSMNETFLFFVVTVSTTVSNRTKDDVEVVKLHQVPVVIRIYN